jgi:glutaminyl-peptide cyclotransferase
LIPRLRLPGYLWIILCGLSAVAQTAPDSAAPGVPGTSQAPVYGFRVIEQKPLSRANFVQGLQILDGQLYLSSGRYGESRLLRYRLADGALLDGRQVDAMLFAEGLTVLGERIYQLTWLSTLVLVYNKSDLRPLEYFKIPGQGWGLTHNGSELIYSDGSDQIHFMSPEARIIHRSIAVRENGLPVESLNELEWIDGQIWANVWRTNRIVIIDPESGEVRGSIDLSGLLPEEERMEDTDVLNGIARDPADGAIWVTGKRWPWLYRIELVARREPAKQSQASGGDSR